MKTEKEALKYIQEQEETDISYVKVGSGSRNLVVSFASIVHSGFDRKTSLVEFKYKRNDFDILYLRDVRQITLGRGNWRKKSIHRWYLGGMEGIGKNINHTKAFLRKHFENYDNIICIGSSMGGYASILFGSILKANHVIAINAQTDLDYVLEKVWRDKRGKLVELRKRKKQCPKTWKLYSNLNKYMDESVNYFVTYLDDDVYLGNKNLNGQFGLILHSSHHLNNIKECKSLKIFKSDQQTPSSRIIEIIEERLCDK